MSPGTDALLRLLRSLQTDNIAHTHVRAMARASAVPRAWAAVLVLAVAASVQARHTLRQLLQVAVPPTWTSKTPLPLPLFVQKPFNLTQPIYGPCAAVSAAIGATVTGGTWSGTMQCAGIDTVYYVGDEPGQDARQMACFSSGGSRCSAGQTNCECQYPAPTDWNWKCLPTGKWYWPFDCASRPSYNSWTGGGPGAGMCLVRDGRVCVRDCS